MKTNTQFLSYLTQFFLDWEIFETKSAEKIKTPILYSISSFFENRAWDNVEKYWVARHATDNNMENTHCILDT